MASPTSEDFQNILKEQKKTNELLAIGNKDPELASSVKQNLGEILNASRLAQQSEIYQKREGITEVDEAQAKTTEELTTVNLSLGDKLQLVFLQLSNIREIALEQLKLSVSSNQIDKKRLEEITDNKKTASQLEEEEKKKGLSLKGMFESISKTFKGFRGDVKDYRNRMLPSKGLFKTAIGAAGLLLGLDFLTGGDGERFFTFIDKMIKAFKSIYKVRIKPLVIIAGDKLDKLITDMADEKLTGKQIIMNNLDTILVGIGLIYARTIAATVLAIGKFAITSGMVSGILSSLFYGKNAAGKKGGFMSYGGTGLIKRAGIVGLVITAVFGVFDALQNALKDESDPAKVTGNNNYTVVAGFLIDSILSGVRDLTSFAIGLVLGERAKELFEKKLKEKGLDDASKDKRVQETVNTLDKTTELVSGLSDDFKYILKSVIPFYNNAQMLRKIVTGGLKFFGVDIETAEVKIRKETRMREGIQKREDDVAKAKYKLDQALLERKKFEESDKRFLRLSDADKEKSRAQFERLTVRKLQNIIGQEEKELKELQNRFLEMFPRYDLANRKFVIDLTKTEKENEIAKREFEERTKEIEMMANRIENVLKESGKELPPVSFLDNKTENNFTNMTFGGRSISLGSQRNGICIAI